MPPPRFKEQGYAALGHEAEPDADAIPHLGARDLGEGSEALVDAAGEAREDRNLWRIRKVVGLEVTGLVVLVVVVVLRVLGQGEIYAFAQVCAVLVGFADWADALGCVVVIWGGEKGVEVAVDVVW